MEKDFLKTEKKLIRNRVFSQKPENLRFLQRRCTQRVISVTLIQAIIFLRVQNVRKGEDRHTDLIAAGHEVLAQFFNDRCSLLWLYGVLV